MPGLARERRQPAHEGAADAEDVQMHRTILEVGPVKSGDGGAAESGIVRVGTREV